jgi:hypothetical protein
LLELAYWIGPEPGVWNDDLDLDQYRDRRQWGRSNYDVRDVWVVFHIYFDASRQIFFQRESDGHTFTGFVSINISDWDRSQGRH